MTSQVQGSNLLDVLKKKMRQTKEEMEKYKEESEDMARKLQVEICRREEVSVTLSKPKCSFNLMLNTIFLCKSANPYQCVLGTEDAAMS